MCGGDFVSLIALSVNSNLFGLKYIVYRVARKSTYL